MDSIESVISNDDGQHGRLRAAWPADKDTSSWAWIRVTLGRNGKPKSCIKIRDCTADETAKIKQLLRESMIYSRMLRINGDEIAWAIATPV